MRIAHSPKINCLLGLALLAVAADSESPKICGHDEEGKPDPAIVKYFSTHGASAVGAPWDAGAGVFVHVVSAGGYSVRAQDFIGGKHRKLTVFDPNSALPWFMNRICVPFNNTNYDVQYGGAHDMDVKTPPGTPITSIVNGTVSSVTRPIWGWQIGIKLDHPIGDASYFAYLHLGAVKPSLAAGQRVAVGDLIAYSGGASSVEQLEGRTNTPFGRQFIDDPSQSGQPQTGFALMRGPEYGVGAGWTTLPDPALDPTPTLKAAQANYRAVETAYEVNDVHGFWTYYTTHGGMSAFGPPVNNEHPSFTGTRQDFAAGSLVWDSARGAVSKVVKGN